MENKGKRGGRESLQRMGDDRQEKMGEKDTGQKKKE